MEKYTLERTTENIYIGYRRNDDVDMMGYKEKGNNTHPMYETIEIIL